MSPPLKQDVKCHEHTDVRGAQLLSHRRIEYCTLKFHQESDLCHQMLGDFSNFPAFF